MKRPDFPDDTRLPVTLLTGFLGAGKTTLLNKVLRQEVGPKIAVIVNEFGEAGLDHDLIEAVDEEVVLMQSGCLCCSIRGDLSRTMQDLIERKQSGRVDFNRVLIETTGLADPAPILQTFMADPFLTQYFYMDGVVTVVDAATGQDTLDRQFEAVSQVAMADILILSKTDLVSDDTKNALQKRLQSINPTTRILQADRGMVPPASLWGLSNPEKLVKSAPFSSSGISPEPPATIDPFTNLTGLAPSPAPDKTLLSHDERIESVSIVLDEPIPGGVFNHWLDTLILLRGPDILRVKGIVYIDDIPMPFAFHGVQHLFDPPVPLHDWPSEDRRSRIVVIARDLSRPELTRSLDMLRAYQSENPNAQSL